MKEKVYFFDWMETLANVRASEKEILTQREHELLLVTPFEEVEFSEGRAEIVHDFLTGVEHFLYSDSVDVMSRLKEEGYRLGIVSDMYDLTEEIVRREFSDFIGMFDVFVTSVGAGFAKPSPNIYLSAINQLNEKTGIYTLPGQITMVGDSERRDIDPASRLGMQARLIDRSYQGLEEVF